jgi:hypothetical protein
LSSGIRRTLKPICVARSRSSAGSNGSIRRTEIILYVYSPVAAPAALDEAASDSGVTASRVTFEFPPRLDDWLTDRWQAFALRRDPRTPWSPTGIRRRVRNSRTVLNAYYPTVTDMRMTRARRVVLKTAASWRYHLRTEWPAVRARSVAADVPLPASRNDWVLSPAHAAVSLACDQRPVS